MQQQLLLLLLPLLLLHLYQLSPRCLVFVAAYRVRIPSLIKECLSAVDGLLGCINTPNHLRVALLLALLAADDIHLVVSSCCCMRCCCCCCLLVHPLGELRLHRRRRELLSLLLLLLLLLLLPMGCLSSVAAAAAAPIGVFACMDCLYLLQGTLLLSPQLTAALPSLPCSSICDFAQAATLCLFQQMR